MQLTLLMCTCTLSPEPQPWLAMSAIDCSFMVYQCRVRPHTPAASSNIATIDVDGVRYGI